jgi:glyoxylase-like metal-dependent hydrolase (beta-lactamase superfamily II)
MRPVTLAVHHVNCATLSPAVSLGGRVTPARMVAHCLVVERDRGLVVVDTGFGSADLAAPRDRMGAPFVRLMRPALDPAETMAAQVRALGHDAADVTDVVLTHLDLDHAGGLGDFPGATVHVFADELAAARARRSVREKSRYVPAQWAHDVRWRAHEVAGDSWLGFESVAALDDDVLLVPLRGHTRGHCGVAVRRPAGGWFLHAGDSFFFHGEMDPAPTCPSGLGIFQALVQLDGRARHANQDRLRSLTAEHGPDSGAAEPVTVFCAHDAVQYDALVGTTD